MASGTIYGTTNDQYIDSKIEWSSVANYDDNTSTITAKLYYRRNNSGFIRGGGTFSLLIDGVSKSVNMSIAIQYNKWVEVLSFSHTVTHNDNGTKSVYISSTGSIWGTTFESTNCAGRITLDTIPRASTVSAAYETTLGSKCKITWTPASATFYYKVKFSLGTFSFTTEAFCPGTTLAYTYTGYPIPYDVATNFPDAISGTMTATLYTYLDDGTTQVGSASSKSFTVTLPENETTKPSLTMTLSPVTPYEKFKSLYLQGISRVKASFGGEGKYGASIVAYSLQAEGGRYVEPYESNILIQSGESTITGFVSDSRWFGNNTSQKINVIAYETPYISPSSANNKVICERCTEDGTADDSGTYLHIKGKRNYTKINENGIENTCSVRCRYKAEGGTWSHTSGGIAILQSTNTSTDDFDVILADVVTDVTLTYTVELNIVDDTNLTSAMVFYIPSEDVTFHLREGGGGAAFGKYANFKALFECMWDAIFHKDIYINNEKVEDFVVEQGSTDIWYYQKWYSGKAECWGRITLDTVDNARNIKCVAGLPFSFTAKPTVNMTLSEATAYEYRQGQIVLSEVYTVGKSEITLYMIRSEGGLVSGNTADVSVNIKGKWK